VSSLSVTAQFEKLLRRAPLIQRYCLRLYVTGTTLRSARAVANIRALCEEFLQGRYNLEVVDVYQDPKEAIHAQIIAAPTLVKERPVPPRRLVGDLSDRARVMIMLDLKAVRVGKKSNTLAV